LPTIKTDKIKKQPILKIAVSAQIKIARFMQKFTKFITDLVEPLKTRIILVEKIKK